MWTKQQTVTPIMNRRTSKSSSSGWPLTSPITKVLGLKGQNHAFFLWRPWAVMQDKQVVDIEWLSTIMLSLQKHWRFDVSTISVHIHLLTDHNSAFKSWHAVNRTNTMKSKTKKYLYWNIINQSQGVQIGELEQKPIITAQCENHLKRDYFFAVDEYSGQTLNQAHSWSERKEWISCLPRPAGQQRGHAETT